MSNFVKRTIVGVILSGIVFLFLYLTSLASPTSYLSHLPIDIFIVVFMLAGTYEMEHVTRKAGYKPIAIPLYIFAAAVYPVAVWGFTRSMYSGLLYCVLLLLLVAFVFFIFRTKHNLNDFIMTAFIMLYPSALMMLAVILNNLYGVIPLVLAVGAGLFADMFAYFVGCTFKGPKIFPKISPKKTVSGFIGGLMGGVLGGLFIYAVFEVAGFPANTAFNFTTAVSKTVGSTISPYIVYCVMGFVCAVFGTMGDLAASKIKRSLGIKDYGTIFAGHGGVMDRLDSLMFTFVAVTVFMSIFYPLA